MFVFELMFYDCVPLVNCKCYVFCPVCPAPELLICCTRFCFTAHVFIEQIKYVDAKSSGSRPITIEEINYHGGDQQADVVNRIVYT